MEEKKWYKNITAILALIGAVVAIVSGMIAITQWDPFKPPKVQHNIEIVLDSSVNFSGEFNGKTKIEAAKAAMKDVLGGRYVINNLALRMFGGQCYDESSTRLAVKFGLHNEENVKKVLDRMTLEGQATLIMAITKAIEDFGDVEQFGDVTKQIIIITGSTDACYTDAADIIRKNLEENKIDADFWFIGMGLSSEQQTNLNNISKVTKGEIFLVNSYEELESALKKVITDMPVRRLRLLDHNLAQNILTYVVDVPPDIRRDIDDIIINMNNVSSHLDKVIQAINQKDYQAAEKEFEDARNEFERSDIPFQNLEKRQTSGQVQMLYELAKEIRDTQNKTLQLSETIIVQAKRNDKEAYYKSAKQLNLLAIEYNERVDRIYELAAKIANR